MHEHDRTKYIERYNNRWEEFGYDPKTLGWGHGKERQLLRFQKLLEIEKLLDSKKIQSVLDVGCGFGDMGGFLKGSRPGIKYLGIDINPLLIEEGKKVHPGVNLAEGDVFDMNFEANQFDLVVESGMFNFKLEKESNLDHIKKYLQYFLDISALGVAADFMTTYVDFSAENNFHLSPEEAYTIAKTLTDDIVLRSDYLKYEFMIYLFKN